jgi:hypothetical protein
MLYQLYGLVIDIDSVLSRVPSADGKHIDIQARQGAFSKAFSAPSKWFMHWHFPEGELWLSFAKVDAGYLLRFNKLADFFVSDKGKRITYLPKPGIPSETINHLLLDQVIPLVINLRGSEALHVSAILTPLGVAAFAGPAGSGKSTLAGALFNRGYPTVSDDCLALMEKNRVIYAIPAYPGLRLWGDALDYLFGDNGTCKPVAHYTDKRRLEIEKLTDAYCTEPQSLKRVYTIADSTIVKGKANVLIERLSSQESFMALVKCAFRLDITDYHMLRRQFHFLERVASRVSVRRLTFPRDFDFLPTVQETIVNDLKDLDN